MDFDDQSLLSMDASTTAGILCTYIKDHTENLKVKHDGVWKPASAQTIACICECSIRLVLHSPGTARSLEHARTSSISE